MSTIDSNYMNAVVGTLMAVVPTHDSTGYAMVIVRCYDPFVSAYVPMMVHNGDDAMMLVDMRVVVHANMVTQM